ncbi:ileal sodium/bile acid cotransporter-like [Macrobrachium rosenbergii]|uniref:ileal sodium/bile acid cotransporter-like n=1 Tax=Macrobrachium rosenbergii TaxID=79674 RepID=UPI0034D59D50
MALKKWNASTWTSAICGAVVLLMHFEATRGEKTTSLFFDPPELKHLVDGTHHEFIWSTNLTGVVSVNATVQDEVVLEITSVGDVIEDKENGTFYGQINVTALVIGYSNITVTLYDAEGSILTEDALPASVILSYQNLSDLFSQIIRVLVAISYVNMGAAMDFSVVKGILKRPIGPGIGMICQYLFMPLISFALGKVVFPDNPMAQLGMFLSGCSPGGGVSNMWTHLLGGSLDLSVMMTFISNVLAFGTLPLWIYLMAPLIIDDKNFVIPFNDIGLILAFLAIPCFIGMACRMFLPRFARFLAKTFAAFSIFNIVFSFTFGVYANLYIFTFFTFKTLLIGFLSPFLGYLSGMLLAKLCCQSREDIIAISIETGVQNNTVAYIILKLSFEKPAGDIAAVFPCAAILMSPIPLAVALLIKKSYGFLARSKSKDITDVKTEKPVTNGSISNASEKSVNQSSPSELTASGKPGGVKPGGVDNPAADLKDDAV